MYVVRVLFYFFIFHLELAGSPCDTYVGSLDCERVLSELSTEEKNDTSSLPSLLCPRGFWCQCFCRLFAGHVEIKTSFIFVVGLAATR